MSYKNLEIYQLADELVKKIHHLTLNDIPYFEKFETGSQIRRSIKSVKANIVEGYARRSHKQQFLFFLSVSYGSMEESIDHLNTLLKTGSLKDSHETRILQEKLDKLARKLYCFIESVKRHHRS